MEELKSLMQEFISHLHGHKHETIALRQLLQNLFTKEPEYAEDVIQLDTVNQTAKFVLRMSFPARYVNVINNTGADIYIATGEPAFQPPTAILIQANRAASFIIGKTQVITVFQSGVAVDGQNTVNFQFSDQPLPMTANTVSVQSINAQVTGSTATLDENSYLKLGGLVKRPFGWNEYYSSASGSATVNFQSAGIWLNRDGSGTALYCVIPSGLNNGAYIRVPFYGRAFGVRLQNTYNTPPFNVLIDGVSYTVNPALSMYANEGTNGIYDDEALILVDDGLSDGLHYAEIDLTAPSSGTSYFTLYGILVDSRAGYMAPDRVDLKLAPIALTTSQAAIYTGNVQYLRGVRQIIYTNTTASPITVTVQDGSNVVWTKNIAANDSQTFDFGAVTAIGSSLTHGASATGVNATVFGGTL